MAVTLTGSDGLFTRLGKLEDLRAKIKTHQDLLETEVDDILDEYNNDRDMALGIEESLESHIASASSPFTTLQAVAQRTVIDMVHADNPLSAKSELLALEELITQMKASADSVDGTTLSSSEAAGGSNVGNGQMFVDFTDGKGDVLEMAKAEDIVVKCTADAQLGKRTEGQELFSIRGEEQVAVTDRKWPDGSGISRNVVASSPDIEENATNAAGRNLLFNGNMEGFAVLGQADSWTYVVGVANTDFKSEGTIKYRGDSSLKMVGDGALLHHMRQQIGGKTGAESNGKVFNETRYLWGCRLRKVTTTTGTLRIRLEDNAGNEVGSSAVSTDLSTLSDSAFTMISKAFSSPLDLPATLQFHFECTTAISSADGVFIDDIFLIPFHVLGNRGPNLIIVPGSTDWVKDDFITSTITNNNEGGFVRAFDRWFNMSKLHLPSNTAGGETILDSLIS